MNPLKKSLRWFSLLILINVISPPMAQAQSDATIFGCYLRENGHLRVVTSVSDCKPGEVPIAWTGTVAPPLVLTASLPDAVIAGINTTAVSTSRGLYGQGYSGVVGQGVFGVAGFSGVNTGIRGEGYVSGVTGRATAAASAGGAFTSSGDIGVGVSGRSEAVALPGTGVSGVASDATALNFDLIGVGVKGLGYFGVWGKGHSTLTADTPAGPAVQGAGVRGEGYYGIYGASATGYAGYFDGQVQVNGPLSATMLLQNSDRDRKANIAPVDGRSILRRMTTLPIQTWNYQHESAGIRHIGPMAQDFYAAFAVGSDDRHIATVDEGGVALAAIQSLYQMTLAQDKRIDQLSNEMLTLKGEIERLTEARRER